MRLSTLDRRQVSPARRRICPISRSSVPIRCCSSRCSRCPYRFGVADVVGRHPRSRIRRGHPCRRLSARQAPLRPPRRHRGYDAARSHAVSRHGLTASAARRTDGLLRDGGALRTRALLLQPRRALADSSWSADGPGHPHQGDCRRLIRRRLLLLRTQPDRQAPPEAGRSGD